MDDSEHSQRRAPETKAVAIGPIEIDADQSRDFMRNIYSVVSEKPSSISHFYKKSFLIKIYDIEQCYMRCTQYFGTLDVISDSISVQINTDSGEYLRASSIFELKRFDQSQKSCVKSVDIEMSFLIRLPETSKPGDFKVEVNFRDIPSILRNSPIDLPDEATSPTRVHLEYPDYVVARSLKLALDEWVDSLDECNDRKFEHFANYMKSLQSLVSIPVIGIISSSGALFYIKSNDEQITTAVEGAAFFAILYFVMRLINAIVGRKLSTTLTKYGMESGFSITRGDRLKIDSRNRLNSRINWIVTFFLVITIFNLFIGLMGNWIFSLIK